MKPYKIATHVGCQWRALPSDFPKWRTVHSCTSPSGASRARIMRSPLERALKNCGRRPARQGRNASSTLDRGRTECKEHDTKGPEGLRRRKKVSASAPHRGGHPGLPYAVAVTTAEVTDRKGSLAGLQALQGSAELSAKRTRPTAAAIGEPFAGVREVLGEQVTCADCQTQRAVHLKVLPKRWV